MERADVQAWLDRYLDAWRANRREPIEALFSEDATYRFRPYGERNIARGRDAIVEAWLKDPDDPGGWDAHYEAFAADGDRAVALGTSHYAATEKDPERTYHNCFLLRFAPDGRCVEFTEFFQLERAT